MPESFPAELNWLVLLPPAPTTAPALFVHVQYPLLAKLLPFKSSSIVAMASIDFDGGFVTDDQKDDVA